MGGLLLCAVVTALDVIWDRPVQFDLTLQTPLMIAFFLSIGWLASWKQLKKGGPEVFKFLLLSTVLLFVQNGVGVALAQLLGQNPLIGLLAGSVSLTGGPGTAVAFSPLFEKAGVQGAATIGTACALAGIIMGGLLGAPLSTLLMKKHKLHGHRSGPRVHPETAESHGAGAEKEVSTPLMTHLVFFVFVMALGTWLSHGIQSAGVTLPLYIGAMIVAAIVRNVQDRSPVMKLSHAHIEEMGSVALSYFLVTATMTLQLKQLVSLASVLMIILAAQAIVVLLSSAFLIFRLSGRDYDAAVMSGGFVGFMLGTTANAMANMESITRRHGAADRAFLVVPLVGACFIDFVNAMVITLSVGLFR